MFGLCRDKEGLNPYFIGLPILIIIKASDLNLQAESLNPYFIGLPILMSQY